MKFDSDLKKSIAVPGDRPRQSGCGPKEVQRPILVSLDTGGKIESDILYIGPKGAISTECETRAESMAVLRIVANLRAHDPQAARVFYGALLGLDVIMDHGWILTFGADGNMKPQLSIASEGGSGSPVPDLSIEVDNVDEIHARAEAASLEIVYPLTDEPWGVRRFYVRDPFGNVVNILSHPAI
jgi:catechol 2,3-dioxygenase-like lactoylglutathione lyase family enzyme